jgi:hypothetical protein
VSLGWCFWHEDCYGCLFCGSRVIYSGVKVRDLFEGGNVEEVMEPPLCLDCIIEMEVGERKSENVAMRRGLGGVERVSGQSLRNRRDGRRAKCVGVEHPESEYVVSFEEAEDGSWQTNGMPLWTMLIRYRCAYQAARAIAREIMIRSRKLWVHLALLFGPTHLTLLTESHFKLARRIKI